MIICRGDREKGSRRFFEIFREAEEMASFVQLDAGGHGSNEKGGHAAALQGKRSSRQRKMVTLPCGEAAKGPIDLGEW
ncbi:MAG: hypothetical protein E5W57_10690 [Mesorhizobium sp.]|nr:MAG: hypothetical protein E5W57_10690 [Mesorhizobium sp.]